MNFINTKRKQSEKKIKERQVQGIKIAKEKWKYKEENANIA
ncbi:hypothetical protein FORC59_p042 (plasmid) [Staphylococcus aureus]|nr:hypothetical protein FORC59_p042 [Staphylococcus aureus]